MKKIAVEAASIGKSPEEVKNETIGHFQWNLNFHKFALSTAIALNLTYYLQKKHEKPKPKFGVNKSLFLLKRNHMRGKFECANLTVEGLMECKFNVVKEGFRFWKTFYPTKSKKCKISAASFFWKRKKLNERLEIIATSQLFKETVSRIE